MFFISFFYPCIRLKFLDVETNPGPRRPVPDVCRILGSNVRGMAGNLIDLPVFLSQCDLLLFSETLVSDVWNVSELLAPGFGRPALFCWVKILQARRMAAYVRDGHGAFRQLNLSLVVAK